MSVYNDLVNESYSIIGIDSKQIEPIILYFYGYCWNRDLTRDIWPCLWLNWFFRFFLGYHISVYFVNKSVEIVKKKKNVEIVILHVTFDLAYD